jgi:RHS repeat-associated protein
MGANWTERSGNLQIYSNTLRNVGTSPDDSLATWNGGSYSNVFASAKVLFTSLAGSLTVGARLGSYSSGLPTAGYAAELISNGQVKLWRLSDWAQLGSTYTISGFQANQVVALGIRANGTTISVEVDGVTRISVTDSSFSSGEVGLWSYDPSSANLHVFDDFVVQMLRPLGSAQALGQGYQPGGKVVAAQKALVQPRTKTAPRAEVMPKSAFTLTRQTGQVWNSYYYAGAARVAMREENDEGSEVYYILTDHLGSTSITVNDAGQRTAQMWYKPWGETREVWGVLPTDRTFTGQREVEALGMLWYNSRFYDAQLGRFNQPDTVVPMASHGVQAWDRFAYVNNNPVKYTDPSGHWPEIDWEINTQEMAQNFTNWVLQTTGLSSQGVTTSDIANILSSASTILDVAAGVADVMAVGVVAAVTIIGAPMAGPEISYPAGELAAKPLLLMGNILATEATLCAAGSELLKGDLGLEMTIQADSSNLDIHGELSIGTGTAIGAITTGIGWIPGVPSWGSLGLQSIAIANDFGVGQSLGLLNGTSLKIPINSSTIKPTNNLYLPLINNEER